MVEYILDRFDVRVTEGALELILVVAEVHRCPHMKESNKKNPQCLMNRELTETKTFFLYANFSVDIASDFRELRSRAPSHHALEDRLTVA